MNTKRTQADEIQEKMRGTKENKKKTEPTKIKAKWVGWGTEK